MRTRRARPDRLRDPVRERLAVAGREPGAHLASAERRPASVRPSRSARPRRSSRAPRSPRRSARRARATARSRARSPAARTSRRSSSSSRSRPASPSRTTYLWCIRSGTPAIARARRAERRDQLAVGLRRRRHRDRVAVVEVVDEADGDAALDRRADRARSVSARLRPGGSRSARSRVTARRRRRTRRSTRAPRRRLAAVSQSADVEHGRLRRQPSLCPHRRDVTTSTRTLRCGAGGSSRTSSRGAALDAARRRGGRLPRRPRLRACRSPRSGS